MFKFFKFQFVCNVFGKTPAQTALQKQNFSRFTLHDLWRDKRSKPRHVTCPGSDPGSNPGSDPSSDPDSNPGSDPSSDPGSDPSSDPVSNPGSDPGSKFRYPHKNLVSISKY